MPDETRSLAENMDACAAVLGAWAAYAQQQARAVDSRVLRMILGALAGGLHYSASEARSVVKERP